MITTEAVNLVNNYDPDVDFDFSFEEYDEKVAQSVPRLSEGEMRIATVTNVDKEFVTVDIGYKSRGMIPTSEFYDEDDEVKVLVGDEVEIFLDSKENHEGQIIVSKEKATKLRIWDAVKTLYEESGTITGKITSKIKGGLVVDIGVKAFLPGSQVDLRPIRNLDKLLGEKFEFRILKYNLKRGNIVLSRRAYLEVDREDRRKKTIETLQEGALVIGHVKNITDYGVFIDLGGIDGLLHITDITWGRIMHPSEMFNIGDEVEVIVLSYDNEGEKVSLGYKQKNNDPWGDIMTKYKVGDKVHGKIVNIMNYGAFIEIEEGIEGLIHISEMSWTKKIKHPSNIVRLDDQVEAVIKEIDEEKKRISLSMKDIQVNPWNQIVEDNPPGTVLTGVIKNVTDFGLFVRVHEGIDGLVHVSDISWSQRPKKLSDIYHKDMEIQVKTLGIDIDKGRLSLGVKQLTPDPWQNLENEISVGDEIQGKVVHVTDFGVFVEIKEGVEGLIHSTEIGNDMTKKTLLGLFPISKKIFTKVLKIDSKERKLGLAVSNNQSEDESLYEYTAITTGDEVADAEKAEEQSNSAESVSEVAVGLDTESISQDEPATESQSKGVESEQGTSATKETDQEESSTENKE